MTDDAAVPLEGDLSVAVVADVPKTGKKSARETDHEAKQKRQPKYNVVLWDDDDHSYDYVEFMMQKLFAHPSAMGHQIAQRVDLAGRAICLTTTREHAELKRDQIQAFGPDTLLESSSCSMRASIEPVPAD